MTKVLMTTEDEFELQYMDWDVEETKNELSRLFSGASEIKYVMSFDEESIIVSVDGISYIVSYDWQCTLYENKFN